MADAMDMQMTPMVAAVPNAVPVSTETIQFKRNVMRMKTDGRTNPAAMQIITGMVPEALQSAVIIPIRRKMIRIFRTLRTPEKDIRRISPGACFFMSP